MALSPLFICRRRGLTEVSEEHCAGAGRPAESGRSGRRVVVVLGLAWY
jgi:hypothetical protein